MGHEEQQKKDQKGMMEKVYQIKEDKFNRQLGVLNNAINTRQQEYQSIAGEIQGLKLRLEQDRKETYSDLANNSHGLSSALADLEDRRVTRIGLIDELQLQLGDLGKELQELEQQRSELSRHQQKNQVKKEILDEEL